MKLTSPLISGFTYTVSYYYSVGEIFSNSFVTNLGVLFVNDTSSINTTLHITNAYTNITYNYNNWYEYSANYTANGNESFLIIGNFNTVSNTNYIYDSANSLFDYNTNTGIIKSYFFIDDVSVIPCEQVGIKEEVKSKEILKIVDVLGRESKPQTNVPLFYIYNDGTVEKRIIIE